MAFVKSNQKRHSLTVFEYGLISASDKANTVARVQKISCQAFEYLKKICLSDEVDSAYLKLKVANGMEVLQMQNYAGVIICPDGTQIEVLPKIAKLDTNADNAEEARLSLLMMLKTLKRFRHIETEVASIKKQKMPLLEVFIAQFLGSVNLLVKKGIKNNYVREQNNSAFLKGKLLHSHQLKHNFVNRHRFYVEYDAYEADQPANRLIRSALQAVSKWAVVSKNKKLVQELSFAFEAVPYSCDYHSDFSAIKLHRGMQHYDVPLKWARLILEGFSPQSMTGRHDAYSLLFPMEAVFESFVAKYLAKHVPKSAKLTSQVQRESLVSYGARQYFRLKPDLYLKSSGGTATIMDTKWKLIDQSKSSGSDKFGLSQSDFYQMLGYGYKYLNSEGLLILIYPRTELFQAPLEHYFSYDPEHKLRLKVVPFDVRPNCHERIAFNELGFI